jgi:hypothetical protein
MNKPIYKTFKVGFLLIFIGCRPTNIANTSMKPLKDSDEVFVFSLNQTVPESSKLLGNLKIVGTVGTACNYEQLISEAKKRARKAGGNIIKITEHEKPRIGLLWPIYCDKIKVNIYFHENTEDIATAQNLVQDSITKSKLGDSSTFAILYVYRPHDLLGAAISFNIHLNDSIICRLKNNSRYEIKLYKEGKAVIRIKKKSKEAVTFDIKPGEEYFFKFIPNSRPKLNIIDKARGRVEYAALKG